MAAVADPEKQLAWEARQRPHAGWAAILAGVFTLGGFIWSAAAFRDVPHSGFLTSLGQAFKPGPIGSQPSLRTPEFEFYDGKAFTFVGSSVIRAIAYLALAYAVTFLIVATRSRRPELPRFIVYITLVGAVLSAVASVFGGVGTVLAVGRFLDGPRTVDAASDVATDSLLYTANLIAVLAPLLVAAGLLMVSLNSMRVGLLTRFLGVLGMLSAALAILSQFLFSFVLTFWLISLGLLFLNLTPGGAPPAWRTGTAEPWPSRREAVEARGAARGSRKPAREPAPEPEAEGEAALTGTRPHPASKKRKRKRRG